MRPSRADGFQKELGMKVQFPPILDRREGIPTGHLRPLGWQNRPEGPVAEEIVTLEPEAFWDKYINQNSTVVFRGLLLGSDAVDKWSDIYLNREYGQLEIKITQRKQKFSSIEEDNQHMTLKKFLQNYRVEDWYLRGIMPEEMQADASLPYLINCGPYVHKVGSKKDQGSERKKTNLVKELLSTYESDEVRTKFEIPKIAQLVEPYLWISAGETSSLIHSHPEHNLHCVIDGRKDFIIIPIDQFKNNKDWRQQLDLHETHRHSNEWYSKIDVDMVNAFKFRILNNMQWYYSSLRAGDCIYLPANTLHQVRSHGRGISTSVYFNPLQIEQSAEKYNAVKHELFQHCEPNAPLFEPLNKYSSDFLWTYTHTERHLNNRNIKLADGKLYLLYLLKNDQQLFRERFDSFYDEITREIKKEAENYIRPIRELVNMPALSIWYEFFINNEDNSERTYLTLKQITNLEQVNLDKFVKILNIAANFHELGHEYKIERDEL